MPLKGQYHKTIHLPLANALWDHEELLLGTGGLRTGSHIAVCTARKMHSCHVLINV